MNRRDFIKFLGMASSATVLSSCGVEKSTEKIIPLLVPHTEPDYLPGEPMFRNAVCTECGAGCGMEVRMVEFNAIKLDGIKGHPVNDGALCLRGQSSLMRLYHPERLKSPMMRNRNASEFQRLSGEDLQPVSWNKAYEMIQAEMAKAQATGKQNVYLSGKLSGSTAALLNDFASTKKVRHIVYEPYAHVNLKNAYHSLYGRKEIPDYKIEKADFLLTIGADIIETFVNPVSNAVQLEKARKANKLKWFHAEPHASLTGYKANAVMKVKPGSEGYLIGYLMNSVAERGKLPAGIAALLPAVSAGKAAQETGLSTDQMDKLVKAFQNARTPLLIVGGVSTEQPNGASIALMGALLQQATGMINNTVDFSHAQQSGDTGTTRNLVDLTASLNRGEVGVAVVSNTNPLVSAPTSIGLGEALNKATFRVAISDFLTETASDCDLILPLSHTLESWSDIELRRGITGFTKPVLKEKLFNTRSEGEILHDLLHSGGAQESAPTFADWIQKRWAARFGDANVDALVSAGYHMDSSILPLAYEIPDPLTTISYGQWVSISKENAEGLALKETTLVNKHRDVLSVNANGATTEYASFVQPGLPKDVYTIQRDMVSSDMLRFDPATGEGLARLDQVEMSATGTQRPLSIQSGGIEQGHRNIVREDHPHEIPWMEGDESLYPDMNDYYPTFRWGITVDMESCTGCSACVAACFIENNIPVVGEEEHLKGREMSWLRVQPYYFEDGTMDNLLMMCQQCDYAPCENVCPVYATYHNDEGLNVMVYNRCVGTRYCHNNCPYKVRRFNWFDWTDQGAWAEPMMRMTNPDIWVRPKGVMEKCTFCYQRIRRGKDLAKDEGRQVRDGEIRTACQDACPTDAITFGNMKDTNSMVYKKSQSNRKFRVLEDLGVGPAVNYLRKEDRA